MGPTKPLRIIGAGLGAGVLLFILNSALDPRAVGEIGASMISIGVMALAPLILLVSGGLLFAGIALLIWYLVRLAVSRPEAEPADEVEILQFHRIAGEIDEGGEPRTRTQHRRAA
jgi:hypothetical protein